MCLDCNDDFDARYRTKVRSPIIGSDPDDGDILSYTITADDSFGKLALNMKTGIIFVTELGAKEGRRNVDHVRRSWWTFF